MVSEVGSGESERLLILDLGLNKNGVRIGIR